MGRTSPPPKGYYTAGQAIKKLHMPRSTFYDMVERGQIKKITPPNRTDGYYSKEDVDRLAKAQEAFILQYATDTTTFEVATEEDIEGIVDLNAELFGNVGSSKNREARLEQRMAQWRANPQIFHVLKQDNIIVGYVGLFPLKQEAIDKIMAGMAESRFRIEVLAPQYITQFKPGEADNVFVIIGAKQDTKKSKLYGARLITGAIDFVETLARKGIIIKRFYGTSRTQDGIRIARGMGFKQVAVPQEEDNLLRFVLDLQESTNPLFKEYQRLVKEASEESQKEEVSSSKAENSDKKPEKVS